MYAKLVFPSNTDYTKIARDIVRCIVNSDGAGGSTVAALEFVTAADSSITDTVAADWSLASGQTLGTGSTNVEQDKLMYLQQTHASTATMTVAIGTSYRDATSGVFTNANDRPDSGVCLSPVSDYGESYEALWGKPATSVSPSGSNSPWWSVTGPEIHIIAKDGCLTLLGKHTTQSNGYTYSSIIEVDTYENRKGRNRAAMAWLIGSSFFNSGFSSDTPSSTSEILDNTSTNGPFTRSNMVDVYLFLIDALYDFTNNEEYRFVGMGNDVSDKLEGRTAPGSGSYQAFPYGVKRDITQSNGCNTQFLAYSTNNSELLKTVAGNSGGYWGYGETAVSWVNGYASVIENDDASPRKPDGTATVFMRPVMPVFGQMKAQFDFSSVGGFYHATANFDGNLNANISDGTDNYVALKLFSTDQTSPVAVAFKK
jgi:hypothetical protein